MLLKRLALVAATLLLGLGLGEAMTLAFFPIDQAPALTMSVTTGLLTHVPGQTGVRYPSLDPRQPVRYAINRQGWNAATDYDSKPQIAIIGDSFVEALQVGLTENVGARLAARLGVRVDSFGMSGAPLSEYLHMARVLLPVYRPDLLVVVLVHNDFTESFDPPDVPLYRSFQRVNVAHVGAADGGWRPVFFDQPAEPYQPRLGSTVMAGPWTIGRAGVRGLRNLQAVSRSLTVGWGHQPPEMGADMTELARHEPQTAAVTRYLFQQFAQLRQDTHTPILFVMDGVRERVHLDAGGSELYPFPERLASYTLNQLAQTEATRNHFDLIDLTPVFLEDWLAHRQPFDFPTDYHWNAYAHDLVAATLAPRVQAIRAGTP